MKKFLFAAVLAVMVGCGGTPSDPVETESSALTTYNSPYGSSTAVHVYVGKYAGDYNTYVLYQRNWDGDCTFTLVGHNGTGTTTDIYVNGTSVQDYMEVVPFNTSTTVNCYFGGVGPYAYTLQSPEQGQCWYPNWPGNWPCPITVDAGGGGDTVICGGTGYGGPGFNLSGVPFEPLTCKGGTGNDVIIGKQPNVMLYGGDGDDVVISQANQHPYTFLYTEGGNDCLQYATGWPNSTPSSGEMSCGAGSDKVAPSSGTNPDCETVVSSCY